MRVRLLLVFAIAALSIRSSLSEEPGTRQRRIAFDRNSTIWTANLDGTKSRKLIKGADPCISPDGTRVAFTISPPEAKDAVRYIAVTEIATGTMKIFKETPSNNCFGPIWSPDGSEILFEIFVSSHWRLGLINADGSNFRFFKTPDRDQGWFSTCWAPDGKSIFCQDLEMICRFGMDGELLESWEISKIVPGSQMDSSERLSVSQDGKRLLMDVGMDEEEAPKDWEGPPPAIWLFDLPSGKATRLTPKKSYASASCWLNDSEFLLVDADQNGKLNSIYRASVAGGTPRVIIKDAANPTLSATPP